MRFPTPFRKDLKAKRKKYKPQAIPSTTIFRKGSVSSKDDLTLSAADQEQASKAQDSVWDAKNVHVGDGCGLGVGVV